MKTDEEKVLVIPKKAFSFHKRFLASPFVTTDTILAQSFATLLSSGQFEFINRREAEHNPDYKQIIPYVVIRRGNEFAVYQRTKKGGESRLHDKWSLGFGGHINPVDGQRNSGNILNAAMRREMREELGLPIPNLGVSPDAFLYDDSDDVGRVHLGLVYVVRIGPKENLSPTDSALSNVRFEHRLDIQKRVLEFENWSQYVINHLINF